VISGDGATTPDLLDFTGENRGLLKIGTSNVPDETLPENIVIENLELRSAHTAYSFSDDHGLTQSYAQNAAALGNDLKDRSAGLVVRNNWIEGGNRQLDLVDGEDSQVIVDDPRYHENFVYGNVLIEPDGAGNSQISHNWMKPGWVASHSGPADLFYDAPGIESAAPGFADEGAQDYRPGAGVDIVEAGGALHPAVLPAARGHTPICRAPGERGAT